MVTFVIFASDMKVREILSKCGRIECQCGMREVFSKCGRLLQNAGGLVGLKSWLESELQGGQLYKSWLGATAHALVFPFLVLHVST